MRHRVRQSDGGGHFVSRFSAAAAAAAVFVRHVTGTHFQPPRVQPFLRLVDAAAAELRVPFFGRRRRRRRSVRDRIRTDR